MNKYRNNSAFTISDLKLLKYLLSNKVASRKQINRDIYLTHKPQSVRYRLKKLNGLGFIKAYRPYASRNDQSNIYSLTSKGLQYIMSQLNSPLTMNRITSDSIEHDLDLVDIKQFFKSKNYILRYFTENQIHNEASFNEDDDLKIFNQLKFDALIEYSKDLVNKGLIPIQYERMGKSKKRYEKIITDYYCERSISMIIYILADQHTKKIMQEVEKKIQKGKEAFKIFYGSSSDLTGNHRLTKFYNQNGKVIEVR